MTVLASIHPALLRINADLKLADMELQRLRVERDAALAAADHARRETAWLEDLMGIRGMTTRVVR